MTAPERRSKLQMHSTIIDSISCRHRCASEKTKIRAALIIRKLVSGVLLRKDFAKPSLQSASHQQPRQIWWSSLACAVAGLSRSASARTGWKACRQCFRAPILAGKKPLRMRAHARGRTEPKVAGASNLPSPDPARRPYAGCRGQSAGRDSTVALFG